MLGFLKDRLLDNLRRSECPTQEPGLPAQDGEGSSSRSENQLITLDSVMTMMKKEINVEETKHMLGKALSRASYVNSSFLNRNDGLLCSETDHGVDFEAAETFFKEIRKPCYRGITKEALHKLLKNLEHSSPSNRIESLRICILLPCCLYVDNTVFDDDVVSRLAQHLNRQSEDFKTILGKWLESIPVLFFRRCVWFFKCYVRKALKRYKTDVIAPKEVSKLYTAMQSCINVLDMLNKINLQRCEPIPFQRFYINKLMDLICIGTDLLGRKKDEKNMRPSNFRFCKFPFCYNPASKFFLLQCQCQEFVERGNLLLFDENPKKTELKIKRDCLVEDSREVFSKYKDKLCRSLDVKFWGENESGGAGITQEYFQLLFKEVLNENFGVFCYDQNTNLQWFKAGSDLDKAHFIGLMCGLALYNNVTVHLQFPPALYKKLLNKPVTFEDLKDVSLQVYNSVEVLSHYTLNDLENKFSLNFGIPVELCPNGSDISVTQENKQDYITKLIDYYLNASISKEFKSFYHGFYTGFPRELLTSFHPKELEEILNGSDEYNFDAFEKAAKYMVYDKDHETIQLFWKVFHDMELEDQKGLLRFLTGTDRIPVYGIEKMTMTIAPRCEAGKNPNELLPQVYTCNKCLLLPEYTTRESMEDKLLIAVRCATGFGLCE